MRSSSILAIIVLLILLADAAMALFIVRTAKHHRQSQAIMRMAVRELGLTDLCLTTEARYTRHPAVSDRVVPFMDHPMDIEHFPSGSFFRPPAHMLTGKVDYAIDPGDTLSGGHQGQPGIQQP